jgi:hypothetical protein
MKLSPKLLIYQGFDIGTAAAAAMPGNAAVPCRQSGRNWC